MEVGTEGVFGGGEGVVAALFQSAVDAHEDAAGGGAALAAAAVTGLAHHHRRTDRPLRAVITS